jgi:hypothetical protein
MAENEQPPRPGTALGEITAELNALKGKDDPESHDRYLELIDELMTFDMGMGPVRRAMGSAAKPEAKPE